MCAGAIVQARVGRLVYGAADPGQGCAGSLYRIPEDPAFPHFCPSDGGVLAGKWKELAALYESQPRLANALSNANLSFREEGGRKVVAFTVTNEAQKKWIEERILRDLEGKFARLTACGKLRLEPTVLPEEEQEKKIYMPSEKAEDLMSKNEEVRNLVVDLGLDIK